METVLKYLSDIRVVILIAVIVVWLVVYLVMQKAKANKYPSLRRSTRIFKG